MFKLYDQDGNCDTYNYNSTTGYLDSVTDDNTGAQINYTYYEIGNPLSYRDGMEMTGSTAETLQPTKRQGQYQL